MGIETLLEKGRGIWLAYDHGMEHGLADFSAASLDPSVVMEIAEKGMFNAVMFQRGVAERYYNGRVPLLLKLNGKTNIVRGDPISRQNCSVEYAVSLGAKAVAYNVYPGSIHEGVMFGEFGKIADEARKRDLGVVMISYPRGEAVMEETSKETVAYAARVALELGADVAKVKYTGDSATFEWAVKGAGKTRVFMSGGPRAPSDEAFLGQVEGVIRAGGAGVAVGRNVWQNSDPLRMARALRQLVIERENLGKVVQTAGM